MSTQYFVTLPPAAAWILLAVGAAFFLWVDLSFFGRKHEPTFREGIVWSVGWLVLSLLAAVVVWVVDSSEAAITYTTVYFIERSLSLDNLFVFLLLFTYFGVPTKWRARPMFWGIVVALALRGVAILGGVALINRFQITIYFFAALLLVLAWRILRGIEESVSPEKNIVVRMVRKVIPVTNEFRGEKWFVWQEQKLYATPLFLCMAAIVAADIAFAVDSLPAAFAITRDPEIIWMGNIFALLGMRALFVLVAWLVTRFRYLTQTIAIVLAIVATKLLLDDVIEIAPEVSLAIVAGVFAIGIIASLIADEKKPSQS